MKTIIIILSLFLSIVTFSLENTNKYLEIEEPRLEAGIIFGYIGSAGLFLEYDLDEFKSLRASGYILKYDNDIIGNIDFTFKNNIHNSKYGEFYLTTNLGSFNVNDVFLILFGAGLGYKYKTEHGINFFFELKKNVIFSLSKKAKKSFLITPLPAMGISVDF